MFVALLTLLGVLVALPAAPASAGPSVDVKAFGPAPALGAPDMALNGGIVDIAAHPTANGYWLLGRDGGVFSYGVPFFGSTGGMRLNRPVVGMTPTPDGNGYWFVAEDGGVFSFGSARFFGSTGSIRLNSRIVGMAATPSGAGYWLVGEDGGVFAFGDAPFYGSTGGVWTGTHMVGIVASGTGAGYMFVGANGNLFSFGDAPRYTAAAMPQGATDVALDAHRQRRMGRRERRRGLRRTATRATWAARTRAIGTPPRSRPPRAVATGSRWCRVRRRARRRPPNSGSGRRIVYSNSAQRVWLVEADNTYAHTFLVSGRRGVPAPSTYHVFSKSVMSSAHNGALRLPYMTRFAVSGSGLAIGFHGIPLRAQRHPDPRRLGARGVPQRGCVRMNQNDIKVLWNWAPIGTTVVVLP